jgi:hypothetical protein
VGAKVVGAKLFSELPDILIGSHLHKAWARKSLGPNSLVSFPF